MRIDIITIFPEYFTPLSLSLIGKAAQRGEIAFGVHDLRSFANDPHRTVDDAPFGGGPGMVMKPEPWGAALDAVLARSPEVAAGPPPSPFAACGDPAGTGANSDPGPAGGPGTSAETGPGAGGNSGETILLVPSPAGEPFTQSVASDLSGAAHLVFACGRYEGIDERVATDARRRMAVREVSIGDYVLAGGEVAVLVMVEAICRLLPGVLGNAESAADDSFGGGVGHMAGLVEGPVFTRPRAWRGLAVPDVLLSGDHQKIARWRRDRALLRTARNRPDLIATLHPDALDFRDREVLSEAGFAVTGEDVAH